MHKLGGGQFEFSKVMLTDDYFSDVSTFFWIKALALYKILFEGQPKKHETLDERDLHNGSTAESISNWL